MRPQQHEVLVKALAERFGLTIEDAWAEWELGGVPILADDVEVMTTDLGLLVSSF